jgi:hypothetical protein
MNINGILDALLDPKEQRVQWYLKHGFSKSDAKKFAAQEIIEEKEHFTKVVRDNKEKLRKKSQAKRTKALNDAHKITKLIGNFKKM